MTEDWIEVRLNDIFEIVTGNTPSKKDVDNYGGEIPFIKPPDIDNQVILNSSEFLSEKGKLKGRVIPPKSTLITCIGNLGRVGLNKYKVAFNQQINALKPLSQIKPEFTFYQAQTTYFRQQLEEKSTSTTVALVNKFNFSTILFQIAPLPIQRAIVAKIEELFSSLDSGIADLKKAQEQLKIYRQAVLKKAFEGNFPERKVSEISQVGTGATPKRGNSKYWENGKVPWITSGALNEPLVNTCQEYITEEALKDTNCKVIPRNSLLIAMYGEGKTRGKCSELGIDAATNQAIATITLNEEYHSSKNFVKWYFIKNYEQIRLLSSGGVQPNLNLSIIKNSLIPFPSPEIQNKIIKEIEASISVCDKMDNLVSENREKAEVLRQTILKKAFEGKLLSEEEVQKCKKKQDYEPADVLLQKIKAEKKKK